MARCNRETLLLPQCETAGCLAHIEEICAMDGVDGIFVGPFDLSIALDIPASSTRRRSMTPFSGYRRPAGSTASCP